MTVTYFEDLQPGQRFATKAITVTAADIKAFAAQFDPQPFHLDENAPTDTLLGGFSASGWHTASLTMRMLAEGELKPAGGMIGAGVDDIRWPTPVRPGDTLQAVCEVLEVRPSKSRTDIGIVKTRVTTSNQHGTVVLIMGPNLVVGRKK